MEEQDMIEHLMTELGIVQGQGDQDHSDDDRGPNDNPPGNPAEEGKPAAQDRAKYDTWANEFAEALEALKQRKTAFTKAQSHKDDMTNDVVWSGISDTMALALVNIDDRIETVMFSNARLNGVPQEVIFNCSTSLIRSGWGHFVRTDPFCRYIWPTHMYNQ